MTTLKRIGFCCKWLNDPSECGGMKVTAVDRNLNGRSTTMRWLREHPLEAEQRQWDIMNHNTAAAVRLIERVATLPANRRMVRLGSEMLQGYTEKDWIDWWQRTEIQDHLARIFAPIGETARRLDVRLSFHPGQFCVLSSENENIVNRSIEEFEYHADMVRWMGFGQKFQDFKINVHISGKRGPAGIRDALKRLSPEARNCITIENDENVWGIDSSLELADDCALVLDLHHHWIRTGEYIQATDPRLLRIIDSWRGVRPALHYSVSREDYLVNFDTTVMPDHRLLLEDGYKKQKLRAHSDFYWNQAANDWALSFWDQFDIQCESKSKNLGSEQVYNRAVELGLADDALSTLATT
jgi:UV DNA damage repair endonuclease